jgi:ribulose-5-phosphate 4-epimerase/fuculose-1-phosphate aldolase
MIDRLKRRILEIAEALKIEGLTQVGDTISVRYEDGIIINRPGSNIFSLSLDDLKVVQRGEKLEANEAIHLAIYGLKKEGNAIIINQAPYCSIVTGKKSKLPAVLDDFAQIVGYSARVSASADLLDILSALKGRNACLIKNGSSLAVGRTLDEAFTGVMVLEKGAKAYVESTIIGNPVKIGLLDSILMNFIYKKKYSKKNQKNLIEKMKNSEGKDE